MHSGPGFSLKLGCEPQGHGRRGGGGGVEVEGSKRRTFDVECPSPLNKGGFLGIPTAVVLASSAAQQQQHHAGLRPTKSLQRAMHPCCDCDSEWLPASVFLS